MHRSLRVALQGRVNSAKRFPELNASLPKGALQGRVNSAKRFLRKRFRVDKLKSMTKFRITFLYNLLTRAESPVRLLMQPDSPRFSYVKVVPTIQ
ncbi:hypothetical protein L9Z41_02035 [Leptospira noguchii]|uniref:hypothetical protein n=1 Tax=Leptospira noguchii TaxID=28182 RepID=UPI001F05C103|nr:hypothetical protein [Leptospira noguchii]MCH1914463.1 hypothetical protein [Leptospira noguchii]